MADIIPVGGGGHGGHGGGSSKKKKQMFMIVGGVGVLLLVLLQKSKQSQPERVDTLQNTIPLSDSQRLDNFQSVMTGQLDANLNGALKDINSSLQNQLKDYDDKNKEFQKLQQDWMKDSLANMKDSLGIGAIRNDTDPTFTIGKGTTGGGNYSDTLDSLRNDRQKLADEIKRTQSVIKYRENNSLDTSAQVQHYKNLEKL